MAITAHAFAKELLTCPDLDLFFIDGVGAQEITGLPHSYVITQEDEENCGDSEGRVGDEVVAVYL